MYICTCNRNESVINKQNKYNYKLCINLGKTSMLKYMCMKWGCEELWADNFDVLIFIECRLKLTHILIIVE